MVYKVARSSIGRAAALSHTGSLAGSNSAYSGAFRSAGIVQVDALDQLLEATLFFAKAPPLPKAEGVIIVCLGLGGLDHGSYLYVEFVNTACLNQTN